VVAWSDDDQCFVGTALGLIDGGCHGEDEVAVLEELTRIVEDVIAIYERDGLALPPSTCGHGHVRSNAG
jgi:hypothetical protein